MSLAITGPRWITLVEWTLPGGDILRLSSEPYCTKPDDTPASTEYIPAVRSIPWALAASSVVHRSGGGAAPLTTIELVNIGRRLNRLFYTVLRDTPMRVLVVEPTAAYSTAVEIAVCQGDRLESYSRGVMTFKLRTIMDTLRLPIAQPFGAGDLISQPQQVVLGDFEFTEGQRVGEADGFVHISDGSWHSVTSVRDLGNTVTAVRRAVEPSVSGLEFTGGIDGKLAIGVKGELWLSTQRVANHTFGSWSGGNPVDWTVVETPPSSSLFQDGAFARFFTGGPTLTCSQNVLTIGETYYAFVDCLAVVSGALEVVCGGVVILRIEESGYHRVAFTAAGTDYTLRGDTAGCDVLLQSATCWVARQTNRVNHILYHLLNQRTGVDFARVDSDSVETVSAAAPWTLGARLDGQTTVFDAVRLALDNVCGDAWADLQGVIRAGRLRDPHLEDAVIAFTPENTAPGITIRHDEMTGLRSRMNYRINGSVHDDSDLDTTDAAVRTRLKNSHLAATATVTPNGHYTLTAQGAPRDSWIRLEADAVAQLDHECGLVTGDAPATLIDWTGYVDPRTGLVDLQPFGCVSLKADEPTLENGRKILLLAAGGDLVRPWQVKCMGWSPSQPSALLLDDGGVLLTDDGAGIALSALSD